MFLSSPGIEVYSVVWINGTCKPLSMFLFVAARMSKIPKPSLCFDCSIYLL